MRAFVSIFVAVVLVPACICAEQAQRVPFSATVLTTSPGGHVEGGRVYFDGSWLRMEGDAYGPDVVVLEQIGNRSYYTLFPQNKTYSQGLILWPEDSQASALLPCPEIPQIKFEKTGEETINGRAAERWLLTSKVTGATLSTRWIDERLKFALRTQHANGTVVELADIDEHRPSKSLFKIPKGYLDAYFPPPPWNQFEEFLLTFHPQGTAPFSAKVSLARPLLMTRNVRIHFDGKVLAIEVSNYTIDVEQAGRERTVFNHRSKESLQNRSPKAAQSVQLKPCATLAGLDCKKAANEIRDGRSSEKWVFRKEDNYEWFETVWYDEALRFPVHAITADGTVLEAEMLKEGLPDRAVFKMPEDYRELRPAMPKLQPICGLVNAPVPCTVK